MITASKAREITLANDELIEASAVSNLVADTICHFSKQKCLLNPILLCYYMHGTFLLDMVGIMLP